MVYLSVLIAAVTNVMVYDSAGSAASPSAKTLAGAAGERTSCAMYTGLS